MNFTELTNGDIDKLDISNINEFRTFVSRLKITQEMISPYVVKPLSSQAYGRNVVLTTKKLEICVISLPSGVSTPIHDHNQSIGCTYIVSGSLVNRLFQLKLNEKKQVINIENTTYFAGDFFYSPYQQIHALSNPYTNTATTFQIFSPPISESNTYHLVKDSLE